MAYIVMAYTVLVISSMLCPLPSYVGLADTLRCDCDNVADGTKTVE